VFEETFILTVQQPLVGQDPLSIEASGSHIHTPHSIWPLRTGDQPEAETSTWQHTTLKKDRHLFPPAGFKTTIPATERPQTHALDRVATGIGFEETKVHWASYHNDMKQNVQPHLVPFNQN
jgi:hypothetical protein